MTFAELFRQYMGNRTLEEMSSLCAQFGLQIDPTYISKLRTGNRPAPDDETRIRLLAKACGGDPEPLVLLAKLERQPHKAIQQLVNDVYDHAMASRYLAHHLTDLLSDVVDMCEHNVPQTEILAYLTAQSKVRELWKQAFDTQERFHVVFKYVRPESVDETFAEPLPSSRPPGLDSPRSEADLLADLADTAGVPAELLGELLSTLKKVVAATSSSKNQGTLGAETNIAIQVNDSEAAPVDDRPAALGKADLHDNREITPLPPPTWATGEAVVTQPPYVAPRTPMEKAIADYLCKEFGLDKIGVFDNVAALANRHSASVQVRLHAGYREGLRFDNLNKGAVTVAEFAATALVLPGSPWDTHFKRFSQSGGAVSDEKAK